jgi:hypothetical protein
VERIMAAFVTKYTVYFPKLYSWLSVTSGQIEVTRDISKAVLFDELLEVERTLGDLKLSEALIQKYKASLVIADSIYWHAPHA